MRGADLLINSLALAGVRRIFSLSGNQIMPLYDACFEAGIEIIHTRHEAAAVYMAEAYAQLTGQVGVAMVTAGAGAANALGPLFTARESDTPVLLLTGDSPLAQDGMGAFQEMPQEAMIGPLVKRSIRPKAVQNLGRDIADACRIAQSGRPGPVHMALPFDVLNEDATGTPMPDADAFRREHMHPTEGEVTETLRALSTAKRPVILCGPILNATRFDALTKLSDAVDAPVIPMESPRGLKDPSLGDIGRILRQADLIVNFGKRVDFTLSFGQAGPFDKNTEWITVLPCAEQRDQAQRNLGTRLKTSIAADARDMARALIEAGEGGDLHSEWRAEVQGLLRQRNFTDDADGRISSAALCAAVQQKIEMCGDAVLICDGGEFGQWAQAAIHAPARVINGISGAIGGGLCYGLAARLARPKATVFSLMGDGTVGFHFAEFETAARLGIPYVVVIGNDLRWNAEHQIQLRDYGPDRLIGCQLSTARYDQAAADLGGHGEYVVHISELDAALDRAVASGKPACVNVLIDGQPAPTASKV